LKGTIKLRAEIACRLSPSARQGKFGTSVQQTHSLSHVALPFPMSDSLYGMQPDPDENFGVNLGAIAPRGERNTLIVSLDALLRMSSNPFFPYMIERIEEGISSSAAETPIKAATPP
jgi:hypothetical protein